MSDVRELTHDYEAWLAGVIDVVPDGLTEKHAAMRETELGFLRGTYYLWLRRVAALLPDVATRTPVTVVGDLHVENFGTWRDAGQVRRWGVNDLDELGHGPWLLDLLRLATSADVAPHIRLDTEDVCEELLAAYAGATPRVATDLKEKGADHLAALVPEFTDADRFYAKLAEGAPTTVPADVARAAAGVAEPGWTPTWHERSAGTGSLGHRRAVGVGPAADGTPHAREAKQLGPGTAVWAGELVTAEADSYDDVVRTVKGPAGSARAGDWQVRDLAPDVVRIELAGLHAHDARHLLRSMAYAVADVHGVRPDELAAAQREAAAMRAKDLAASVATMVASTQEDWSVWASRV